MARNLTLDSRERLAVASRKYSELYVEPEGRARRRGCVWVWRVPDASGVPRNQAEAPRTAEGTRCR